MVAVSCVNLIKGRRKLFITADISVPGSSFRIRARMPLRFCWFTFSLFILLNLAVTVMVVIATTATITSIVGTTIVMVTSMVIVIFMGRPTSLRWFLSRGHGWPSGCRRGRRPLLRRKWGRPGRWVVLFRR